jgi:Cation transport protein
MCGSAIFVSIFVIHLRKKAFEKRFGDILKAQEEQRRKRRETLRDTSGLSFSMRMSPSSYTSPTIANEMGDISEKPVPDEPQNLKISAGGGLQIDIAEEYGSPDKMERSGAGELSTSKDAVEYPHASHRKAKVPTNKEPNPEDAITAEPATVNTNQSDSDHVVFVPGTSFNPTANMDRTSRIKRRNSTFSFTGVGASPVTTSFRRPGFSELTDRRPTRPALNPELTDNSAKPWHYGGFLRKEVVGRNSQFHGLTREEREQLGGVEYRAITLLSWVVPLYFVLWQLLGCLGVGAWMAYNASDITEANGINPWYVLFFSNCILEFILIVKGGMVLLMLLAHSIIQACHCLTQIWYANTTLFSIQSTQDVLGSFPDGYISGVHYGTPHSRRQYRVCLVYLTRPSFYRIFPNSV